MSRYQYLAFLFLSFFFLFSVFTICVSEKSVRGYSSASSVHLVYEMHFYHVLYSRGQKRSFVMFILEKLWVLF